MKLTAKAVMKMPLKVIALDHYFPDKRKRREPDTVYGYESSTNLHVIPRWGDMRITDITHDDVQDWVDELAETKAGKSGAWKAFKCLRQIIYWAIDKWGLYVADPCRGIEKPRERAYHPPTLTERRLKRLIRGLVGCEFEPTAIIQCSLGCRPSENYFLHWEWINWRTGEVPIFGSIHEIPGLIYESLTKTPKGDRVAFLPPWALDRLHTLWIAAGRPKGRIIGDAKPSKVYRVIKTWVRVNHLPWVGMKNLRHTWGSIAAKTNPIELVAGIMGHSNIQITYAYYYQLAKASIKRAQRKVARSILGKTCDDMYKGIAIVTNTRALARAA